MDPRIPKVKRDLLLGSRRGLYRKSLAEIPENLKIGVLQIINLYRPRIQEKLYKYKKKGVWQNINSA